MRIRDLFEKNIFGIMQKKSLAFKVNSLFLDIIHIDGIVYYVHYRKNFLTMNVSINFENMLIAGRQLCFFSNQVVK